MAAPRMHLRTVEVGHLVVEVVLHTPLRLLILAHQLHPAVPITLRPRPLAVATLAVNMVLLHRLHQ